MSKKSNIQAEALTVVRLGHPALRAKSVRVTKKELVTPKFQRFLDDLAGLCVKSNGVGIAAPQVSVNKRIIVVHVDPTNPRYPGKQSFPLTIMINPKVAGRSKQMNEDWEGDLSCGFRAVVPRSNSCIVRGLDRQGKKLELELKYDFHARVFQHEIDDLNGVLLIDRVKRMNTLSELPEWEKYWKGRPL